MIAIYKGLNGRRWRAAEQLHYFNSSFTIIADYFGFFSNNLLKLQKPKFLKSIRTDLKKRFWFKFKDSEKLTGGI